MSERTLDIFACCPADYVSVYGHSDESPSQALEITFWAIIELGKVLWEKDHLFLIMRGSLEQPLKEAVIAIGGFPSICPERLALN